MPNTVPNQKTIRIHREPLGNSFLGIKTESFANAYRELNATATILYLYLANNKDGFDLAFSPQAVSIELGMPQSTCRDQFKKLIDNGYLVPKKDGSSIYDFYEVPKKEIANKVENEETKSVSVENSLTAFDF